MNHRNQNNKKQSSIMQNSVLRFVVLNLMISVICLGLGYFVVVGVLKASDHFSRAEVNKSENEGDINPLDAEGPLSGEEEVAYQTKSISFDEQTIYYLQVSGLSDESGAKSAIDVFKKEGIDARYIKVGETYKVIAHFSPDQTSIDELKTKFVALHPKYADAFTFSNVYKWDTDQVTFASDTTINGDSFTKAFRELLVTMSDSQLNSELNERGLSARYDEIHALTLALIGNESNLDISFTKKWVSLDDLLKNLMDRKASIGEFNSSLLGWILENAY